MLRRSVRRRAATLLALLLMLLGAAAGVRAQGQTPITINDVRAGYEGAYRLGEWFPVVVDVSNAGPDLRAVLEWSLPGRFDEPVFQRTIDLPRGSRKRVVLEVYTASFVRNGMVRLLDGSAELATHDVTIEAIDESVFLVGVVSSDPALLNSLDGQPIGGFASTRVRHLAAGDMPDSAATLRGLNAVFLHDLDSAALQPGQRSALALWVGLGGQLVLSGGGAGQQAAAGWGDLLPVTAVGSPTVGDLSALAQLAGGSLGSLPASTTLSQAQARRGAERLPPNNQLIFRHGYGAGLVSFSAFDFASLRGWPGEASLWGQVLRQVLPLMPGAVAHLSQFNLLDRGVLKLPALDLPSPWTLLLFMLAYVLVIGPLNYVVLRRMRRLELAWITVPAVVLLFTAGLYAAGTLLRGGESQYNQLSIVESSEGQRQGLATSFIGLFSPRRATYTLGFPAATLVTGGPTQLFLNARFEPVRVDEAGAPSISVLADISSVTTFVAETTVDLPVQVQSQITDSPGGLRGEIHNSGALALEDAILVRGESFVRLGTLAPGERKQVLQADALPGFPNSLGLGASGVFERQSMINLLFDRTALQLRGSGATPGTLDAEGVYLLAWISQPAIPASVNGLAAAQNSLTLYVLRLATA